MKKILMLIILGMFCISLVSAGVTKSFVKDEIKSTDMTKYGKITLKEKSWIDIFGWFEKTKELTLKDNTEICKNGKCNANLEVVLEDDGVLIEDIRFIGDKPKSYEIYVNDKPYEIGTEVNKGTYEVNIEGKLSILQTTDWQIKVGGYWIDEWALWTGADGLRAYYDFDEGTGTNVVNMLNGSYNMTAVNMSWSPNGVTGYSIDRNQTSDSGLNAGDLDLPGDFSIQMWVKFYALPTSTDSNLLNKAGFNYNLYVDDADDSIKCYDTTPRDFSYTPPEDKWVQIVLVHDDSANLMGLWINGTFISNVTFGAVVSDGDATFSSVAVTGAGGDFNGSMDLVGVWERILDPDEIDELYNGGLGLRFGGIYEEVITTLNSPSDNLETANRTLSFNASFSVIGGINLTNATLKIWDSSNNLIGSNTTTITGTSNETTSSISELPIADSHVWNYYACGTNSSDDTICSYASNNRTFNITYLTENSQTYDSSVTEGSTNNFTANISYDSSFWSLITASLWYNYTEYSGSKLGTGDTVIFHKAVSAPDVQGTTNVPFNWRVGLTNASGTYYTNLTNYTQAVNTVNMSVCGSPYTTPFMNFTFYDEETMEKVNGTIDLTFNYRSSTSPTTFNDVFSYVNNSVDVQSHQFCFDPADETFTVDAIISYEAPTYTHRFYNFEGIEFTNTTTEIGLYLLNESKSTSFIIEVIDNNYYPLDGAEVYVQRYYPSTNSWITLEILETNEDGKTIQHLFTEDVLYRFKVYESGTLLHTTTQSVIACEATPCTLTIVIPGEIENIYTPTENLDTSLTMDASFLISFTYSDTSGNFESSRLEVTRQDYGVPSIQPVCNSTSTTATAVLTCDLFSETNGTYIAKGFITRTGESEDNVERKVFYKIRDIIAGVGLDGLLWSIFFLMGIIMLGIYRPSLAIIFAITGVFLLSLLQLMEISITAIVAIIGIGVVLLVGVRKQ